jgi:hypothetical protein
MSDQSFLVGGHGSTHTDRLIRGVQLSEFPESSREETGVPSFDANLLSGGLSF